MALLFAALLSAGGPAPARAATLEVIAEFERPGTVPKSRLVYVASEGAYFGTTSNGGIHGHGTIFKLVGTTRTTLVSFTGQNGSFKGSEPDSALIQGADGLLYGTTPKGGSADCGTLFKVSPSGAFSTLVEFTGTSGIYKGSAPGELLLQGGSFYGTTEGGGGLDCGTIFRYTPLLAPLLSTFTTLVEFTGTSGARRGTSPKGALISNGSEFFGVTESGGNSDYGTVFRFSIGLLDSISWSTLVHFNGLANGGYPSGGLVQHPSDGYLYGTTELGGDPVEDCGVIFKVGTSGSSFQVLKAFADYDGSVPKGPLVLAGDNNLYGVTTYGGDDGYGTIFRITPGWIFTSLVSFSGGSGSKLGEAPESGLSIGQDGHLYGTTSSGGDTERGTVYRCTTSGQFTTLAEFTSTLGWKPAGGPLADGSGSLYLPMAHGGIQGTGTLVRVASGPTVKLADFSSSLGELPDGGMVQSGGFLYGAAQEGGGSGRGTIYKYSPGGGTSAITTLTTSSGSAPEGPFTLGPDGNFYVVAREGGVASPRKGAILRVSPSGVRTTLVSFTGTTGGVLGEKPRAPLAFGSDGSLYGVTEKGGINDKGTIFKISSQGVFSTLVEFASSGPNTPLGGLVQGFDGTFLGTTGAGGVEDKGTVFRITEGGVLTVLGEFTGSSGALRGSTPAGALAVAPDGALYGIATDSGSSGYGTLFRFRPDGVPETLIDFTGPGGTSPGSAPTGGLTRGADGFLYGATEEGGPQGGGVVFRLRNIGPTAVTDAVSYPGLITTVNGRVFTGAISTSAWFEVAVLPELLPLPLSIVLPTQTATEGGVLKFSAPVLNLPLGNLLYYRACADNSEGSSKGIIRSVTGLAPIQKWKSHYLGDPDASDVGDDDRDGSLNLAEYGLMTNPTTGTSIPQSAPQFKNYPEGQRLALSLQRDPERTDITIEVKAASSLTGPWTTVASSVNGAPFSGPGYVAGDSNTSGSKTVEIRDVPPANSPMRFMKVVITH